MAQRIGLYGGTFDPVHLAHLVLAERAREQLALDRVHLVPAAIPPHKRDLAITPGKSRIEMLELALAGQSALIADDIELDRAGVSYTVDTLHALADCYVGAELYLLVGSDTVDDIPTWKNPEEIVRISMIAVARRPGAEVIHTLPADRVTLLDMPAMEVSSTEIRDRVRTGRSIRYLVPAAVEAYIDAHGLYRGPLPGGAGG